jgi:hypothetical protein
MNRLSVQKRNRESHFFRSEFTGGKNSVLLLETILKKLLPAAYSNGDLRSTI